VSNSLYVILVELMEMRLGRIAAGELYSPGDFMYTNTERSLALDFALLRRHLNAKGMPSQHQRILEVVIKSGVHDNGAPLNAASVGALAEEFGDRYFFDDDWRDRISPDLISVVTGQECYPPSSDDQAALQSEIAFLLGYDLQILHWSLLDLSAESHEYDFAQIEDERAQMNALFEHRHGCVSQADVGLAVAVEQIISLKPFMLPIKRFFDTVVTLFLLIMLSPLIIAIMAIMSVSTGPIFYSQRRIGRNGRIFRCQKFATMVPNAERILANLLASDPQVYAEWQQYEKLRNDPRITKLGRFLRKTSLDELPQILNVLRGEMSLVGPRPMAVHERERWNGQYRSYTAVRPGVTGPWQIYHRSDSDYETRIKSMEHYITNWSLLGDLKYLILTIIVPFSGRGA